MFTRFIQGVVIGLISAAVAIVLWQFGILNILENYSWDWRVKTLAKPGVATDDIRIIMLDQPSLDWGKEKERGWGWPWWRQCYEPVIAFCKRSGAKAVAFDMIFSEPSVYQVDDDNALGEAIAASSNFVGAFTLSDDISSSTNWPAEYKANGIRFYGVQNKPGLMSSITMKYASFPVLQVLTNAAVLGNVAASELGEGAVARYTTPFYMFCGQLVPSLGMAAYLASEGKPDVRIGNGFLYVGDKKAPLDNAGKTVLNFRGPSMTHKTVSAAAVIQSELRLRENGKPVIDPSFFKDRYVFFGSSATALLDLKPTPISNIYPGVEINATMLDNLLSGDFIREVDKWPVIIFTVLIAVLAGVSIRLCQNGVQAGLVCLFVLPVPVVAGFVAYSRCYWLPVAVEEVGAIIGLVGAVFVNYALEGKQKRYIKGAFGQYISREFIERLIENPGQLKLGGETRELTIFFSDLQGFTSISESLTPEKLTALLNDYLTPMTDIVMNSGGTVDKYIGDAVVAFWNAPLNLDDHPSHAVRSALLSQQKLAELRPLFKEQTGWDVYARMGINTGKVVVGNMGSNQRFNYTFLGDAGNLAARLEGLNKQFGTFIMITEMTRKRLSPEFGCRELGRVRVKGKKEPVTVYEPMFKAEYDKRAQVFETFDKGLQLFYAGDFLVAKNVFMTIEGEDAPAKSYLQRIDYLVSHPPTAWDGVLDIKEK